MNLISVELSLKNISKRSEEGPLLRGPGSEAGTGGTLAHCDQQVSISVLCFTVTVNKKYNS